MSMFQYCTYENLEVYLVDHLAKCQQCGEIHDGGWSNLCTMGRDLFDNFKRALMERHESANA